VNEHQVASGGISDVRNLGGVKSNAKVFKLLLHVHRYPHELVFAKTTIEQKCFKLKQQKCFKLKQSQMFN
jgi:hypothetical protein